MRTIAAVTMFFLPGMFTAVSFSTEYRVLVVPLTSTDTLFNLFFRLASRRVIGHAFAISLDLLDDYRRCDTSRSSVLVPLREQEEAHRRTPRLNGYQEAPEPDALAQL